MFQRRLSLRSLSLLPFLALWFLSGCFSRYQFSSSPTPVPNIPDSASYTAANSPLSFRNYLTCSFSEQFGNAFTVDNSFYVSKFVNQRFDKHSPANAKKLYVTYLVRIDNTPKASAHLLSVSRVFGSSLQINNNLGISYEYIARSGRNGFLAGFDRTTARSQSGVSIINKKNAFRNNYFLGYKWYYFQNEPRTLMPLAGVSAGYVQSHNSVEITGIYYAQYLVDRKLPYLGGQLGCQYTAWRRITAQTGLMAGGGMQFSTSSSDNGAGAVVTQSSSIQGFLQLYASVGIRL